MQRKASLIIRLDDVHASERQDGGAPILALASDKEGALVEIIEQLVTDDDKLRPFKLSSWVLRRLVVAYTQIVIGS